MQQKLIDTLLRAALEQAEAERGMLLLWRTSEFRIAAEATRRDDAIVVRVRDEVVTASLLPESLLHYVQRTRECVVIDDAAIQARFAGDPYVRQHTAGWMLCLPLLNETKFVGMLFLENHLTFSVIAATRVTALKLVSSLAASALDNSRLYGDLQEREAKIRRLVDANIIGIYIIDLGGPILEANDAYLRMLGYKRKDLVSGLLRWTDLTPPDWRAADVQRVERVKRVGRLQPFEKEYFHKDGTRVPVLVGVARFKEPRNQAVVFALDMSEQKRAQAIALEARTIKQMYVARKLHDALLQNFQGIMFRFQAARNLMPRHPDEALRTLNEAINDGVKALDESLDAIQGLRSEPIA